VQASRLSGARRRGGQKQAGHSQNDDSNREFRHCTLPGPPISARRERPMEPKVPEGDQPSSNASWVAATLRIGAGTGFSFLQARILTRTRTSAAIGPSSR